MRDARQSVFVARNRFPARIARRVVSCEAGDAATDQPLLNTTIGEVRAIRSVPIQPATATSSAAPATSITSGRIGGA